MSDRNTFSDFFEWAKSHPDYQQELKELAYDEILALKKENQRLLTELSEAKRRQHMSDLNYDNLSCLERDRWNRIKELRKELEVYKSILAEACQELEYEQKSTYCREPWSKERWLEYFETSKKNDLGKAREELKGANDGDN